MAHVWRSLGVCGVSLRLVWAGFTYHAWAVLENVSGWKICTRSVGGLRRSMILQGVKGLFLEAAGDAITIYCLQPADAEEAPTLFANTSLACVEFVRRRCFFWSC